MVDAAVITSFLKDSELASFGLSKDAETRSSGNKLTQQPHSLCHQFTDEIVHASCIAARPIEASDETKLNRISGHPEHDWDRRGGGLSGTSGIGIRRRDDHRDVSGGPARRPSPAVGRIARPPSGIPRIRSGPPHSRLRPSRSGTPLLSIQMTQPSHCEEIRSPASPPAAHAPLAATRRRAAEQRDELATLHVWMAPVWQEVIWRAAVRSLAVMCPAC